MADATDQHLGKRLRQRRWMLGLTQTQVGDLVGIKFQQVQKYETGQNRISASRLWELSQALEVPVSYFYEGLRGPGEAGEGERASDAGASETSADAGRMADRETVELVRAYFALPETPRRRILEMVRAFSRLDLRTDGAQDAAPRHERREAAAAINEVASHRREAV